MLGQTHIHRAVVVYLRQPARTWLCGQDRGLDEAQLMQKQKQQQQEQEPQHQQQQLQLTQHWHLLS